MAGILSFGVYIPYFRLDRKAIGEAQGIGVAVRHCGRIAPKIRRADLLPIYLPGSVIVTAAIRFFNEGERLRRGFDRR